MSEQSPGANEHAARSKAALLAELAAVLFLLTAPTIASLGSAAVTGNENEESAVSRRHAKTEAADFAAAEFRSAILRLRYLPILLFVMWRSGEGWARFGLVKPRIGKDLLIGVGLWAVVATVDALIALAFHRHDAAHGLYALATPWARAVPLALHSCVVALVEETSMRGYLIPRFESLTRSTWLSLALSVAVFAFVHVYKTNVGILHSAAAAAIWGLGFCLTRRIWPLVLSHALVDFIVGTHIGVPG